jgi:hypothetical protein
MSTFGVTRPFAPGPQTPHQDPSRTCGRRGKRRHEDHKMLRQTGHT